MKQSILVDIGKLQERQMGYVASMSYQYSQLCLKADPALLLGIVLDDGGVERNIEDMAQVVVYEQDDKRNRMDLIPVSNEAIPILAKGVTEYYPEIHQSVETNDPDEDDPEIAEQRKDVEEQFGMTLPQQEKSYFIVLTMPEVDDDRKKLLDDAVKVIYDATKVRMDATASFYTATVTAKTVGETPDVAKAAIDKLDAMKKQYEDLREQLTESQKKDIQAANDLYHKKQAEAPQDSPDDGEWKKLKVN